MPALSCSAGHYATAGHGSGHPSTPPIATGVVKTSSGDCAVGVDREPPRGLGPPGPQWPVPAHTSACSSLPQKSVLEKREQLPGTAVDGKALFNFHPRCAGQTVAQLWIA